MVKIEVFNYLKCYKRNLDRYEPVFVDGNKVSLTQYAEATLLGQEAEIHSEISRVCQLEDAPVLILNVLRHNFTDYDREIRGKSGKEGHLTQNSANVKVTHKYLDSIKQYYQELGKALTKNYESNLSQAMKKTEKFAQEKRHLEMEKDAEIEELKNKLYLAQETVVWIVRQIKADESLSDLLSKYKELKQERDHIDRSRSGYKRYNNRYRRVTNSMREFFGVGFRDVELVAMAGGEAREAGLKVLREKAYGFLQGVCDELTLPIDCETQRH